MPSQDYMSNDYVANLLTKDAKESTIKYSALGLQAFLPKRPTTNAPRPNTRFLKNIIRETDSHNAALKAKEAEEARVRFRRLHGADAPRSTSAGWRDRAVDTWHDRDEPHHKRRRVSGDDDQDDRRRRRHAESSSHRSSKHADKDGDHHRRSRRHKDEDSSEDGDDQQRPHRHHRHRHRHERRDRSQSEHPVSRHSATRKARRRPRSRSVSSESDREHHRSRRRKRHSPPAPLNTESAVPTQPDKAGNANPDSGGKGVAHESDSDPLEAIIGPPRPPPVPKVRPRGRGTFASASAMDSHFSSTYDPSADVRPNSDSENDWDQALEALRDRQRWKQQGADRLRSAGFTEEEVSKWEKGGEKREEDVRWKGRGEGREWDRGKVVDEDGIVDTKPEWGRLKGT